MVYPGIIASRTLSGLTDVAINNPVNGNFLSYDNQFWINKDFVSSVMQSFGQETGEPTGFRYTNTESNFNLSLSDPTTTRRVFIIS